MTTAYETPMADRARVTDPGAGTDAVDAVPPAEVHERLARHVLVDGYRLVVDLERSRGARLVDARDGRSYLDCYSFFASQPLGFNHPALAGDRVFLRRLARAALHKPANPDMYSVEYATFVEVFARVLGDPALPHLFFVEGGALAVENALKVAFDWKSRRNEAAGRAQPGDQVLHLRHAFHGRSGYTLSLTNTDPTKTDRFPKLPWPRLESPALRFPLDAHTAANDAADAAVLARAEAVFAAAPHRIACFVAEPIQAEGGDRHLSAPFLRGMQELCRAHDALFILDEVQTGVGMTGRRWAYEALGLEPDVVAFAKKAQIGGVMAGRRVDEVVDNVFCVPGRISSTWGGGLADMVRSTRILQVIERDGLVAHAAVVGDRLRAGLEELARRRPESLDNARGRGLLCAVDLPDTTARDDTLRRLREEGGVIALACGEHSIRFRPPLTITAPEVDETIGALDRAIGARGG